MSADWTLMPGPARFSHDDEAKALSKDVFLTYAGIEQMKLANLVDPDVRKLRDRAVEAGVGVKNEMLGAREDAAKVCSLADDLIFYLGKAKDRTLSQADEKELLVKLLGNVSKLLQSFESRGKAFNQYHQVFIILTEKHIPEVHSLVAMRRDIANRKFQKASDLQTVLLCTTLLATVGVVFFPPLAPLVGISWVASQEAGAKAEEHYQKREVSITALQHLKEIAETIKKVGDISQNFAERLRILAGNLKRAQEKSEAAGRGAAMSMTSLELEMAIDAWKKVELGQNRLAAVIGACNNHFEARMSIAGL